MTQQEARQGERYRHIAFSQRGRQARITFDRPDVLNALNRALIDEALDALERIAPDTRVLVLRGAGDKAFAAGADIQEMQQRTLWTELDAGPRRELARRLERAPFPTVAALNGLALGGGLELALACHLRIATEHARLGLPETRLGIIPGNGGTARLARLIGRGRALQMILLGEQIDALEAERLGIVNWVVPAERFDAEVDALAQRLEQLAPVATRAAIDCVTQGGELTLEQAIENEHRWFQICIASPDKREGVQAFLEKRRPNFSGIDGTT
ncbi:MAG TPA: enoyl-CoA hydratase-related protein [Burkholderiaceae bacterium]|nr:enoyl-CoA hydratase-related protein [Burkholderiaceae bacterium]